MPLESGDYIADLNEANPVGSSDLVSQGDDHLRLLKKCVRQSFPNVSGEVTATHTQLSALNGGTLAAANGSNLTNLNGSAIASGTVADARLSSNVALYDASMASFSAGTLPDARLSSNVAKLDATNAFTGTVTFNGVNVTDYARLSQANVFTRDGANNAQQITTSQDTHYAELQLRNGEDGVTGLEVGFSGSAASFNAGDAWLYTPSGVGLKFHTGGSGTARAEITAAGVFNYGGNEVGFKGLPSASSSEENGKVLALTGNHTVATGGVAGQVWVYYNNTGSAITLTQGSGLTLRLGGTTTTGNRTLLPRGFATCYAVSSTEYVVTGHVS